MRADLETPFIHPHRPGYLYIHTQHLDPRIAYTSKINSSLDHTLRKYGEQYITYFIKRFDIYKEKRPKSETIIDFYLNVLLKHVYIIISF
jgi:hypothetical protein